MRDFKKLFSLEFSSILSQRNILIIVLFWFIVLYSVNCGLLDYESIMKDRAEFKKLEKEKIRHYLNYKHYGIYGIKYFFQPSPIHVFVFRSAQFSNVVAHIDVCESLSLFVVKKGKRIFEDDFIFRFDFLSVMFFCGSILALLYGTFYREFYLFLSNRSGFKRFFFLALSVRTLIVLFLLLLTVCTAVLFSLLMGVVLPLVPVIIFTIFSFILLMFFFALGVLLSFLRKGRILAVALWLTFMMVIPGLISDVTISRSQYIRSIHRTELEKLRSVFDFELRAGKKFGKPDYNDKNKTQKVFDIYLNDLPFRIDSIEAEVLEISKAISDFKKKCSLFFPSSFYLSLNKENSSSGFDAYFCFYNYVRSEKKEFIHFILERLAKHGVKTVELESFIKGEKNIYRSKSTLPLVFAVLGAVFTLIYTILLFYGSYKLFLKSLPKPEKLKVKIKEHKKGFMLVYFSNPGSIRKYICYFMESGKRYLYVPPLDSFPEDIKVKDVYNFFELIPPKDCKKKRFYHLSIEERGKALIEICSKNDSESIVLVDFIPLNEDFKLFYPELSELKKKKAVIYFGGSLLITTGQRLPIDVSERIE